MNIDKMGIFIREERKRKNLNQRQLAELMEISTTTVCKWEKGVNTPDIANLEKLAEIFEVSIQEILNGKASSEEKNAAKEIPVSLPADLPDIPVDSHTMKKRSVFTVKRLLKTIAAFLLAFWMIIVTVNIVHSYASQPKFSVIQTFCPETGYLGIYEEYYNREDVFCIVVEYRGNIEEDDFEQYNNTLYEKYYPCFKEYKTIAVGYFEHYNRDKDTLNTSSYQSFFFDTKNI